MIDEAILMDEIEKFPYIHERYDHKNANMDFINGVETMYEMVMHKIKEQTKVNDWVSCENPPKDNHRVLIYNGESYSVGYYNGEKWINAIHPIMWQKIRNKHDQSLKNIP